MALDVSERNCVDLDECNTEGYCENGKCTNKPDGQGFDCQCDTGFMKTMDGKSCEGMLVCDVIIIINQKILFCISI